MQRMGFQFPSLIMPCHVTLLASIISASSEPSTIDHRPSRLITCVVPVLNLLKICQHKTFRIRAAPWSPSPKHPFLVAMVNGTLNMDGFSLLRCAGCPVPGRFLLFAPFGRQRRVSDGPAFASRHLRVAEEAEWLFTIVLKQWDISAECRANANTLCTSYMGKDC
jgi:hypothetical protein